ncbi:DUF2254 domain-containing protein [Dermatobacter hominis]|uniref:DUF2254 domain-containing protein n=1 Tax=Dermatobacter hominis TaxID=2884263 RepID=UPI001D10126F|nr:DUF2254 domain-containing protein [Dermatobacter hominis]UDY36308.1 DUF2254 domain-containing protein [Dermatobacter hominis]
MLHGHRLTRWVRSALWLVPLLCVLGGVALSIATLAIDRAYDDGLVSPRLTGTPTAVQTFLSTVATATITLGSLVLTVTTVAVQLAMGQFSPRIVSALLNDRRSQLAIGLFGATFVYALLVMRDVDDQSGSVPGLSVVIAGVLMLASIAGLFLFVQHAGQHLRAGGLIDLVGDNSRKQFDQQYPADPRSDDGRAPDVVAAPDPGAVVRVLDARLVAAARHADCVLELLPAMGDFVPAGAPLFRIHGDPTPVDHAAVARMVVLGSERTHADDGAYGFRKLVDIAVRSVAQPFDDPTTCVQAIDRLHDGLRQLAARRFPSGLHRDEDGHVRLVVRATTWDAYVRLAFDEIRLASTESPQVTRRLVAALEDIKTVAPPERQAPLDRELRLLATAVHRHYDDEEDRRAALTADAQGIGSGLDLTGPEDRTWNDRRPAHESSHARSATR